MSDPMDRDQFPGRPDHPDFWHMSDVVNYLDGEATEGGRSVPEISSDYIDIDVVQYFARMRAMKMIEQLKLLGNFSEEAEILMHGALAAAISDGLISGARFERLYGKGTSAQARREDS